MEQRANARSFLESKQLSVAINLDEIMSYLVAAANLPLLNSEAGSEIPHPVFFTQNV